MIAPSGIDKAWQATQVQALRRSQRFTDRLAKTHAFTHLEGVGANRGRRRMPDDDAVIVDSPTTVNHYHKPGTMTPWVILLAAILAGMVGAGLLYLVLRPAPVSRPPLPPARTAGYIEVY